MKLEFSWQILEETQISSFIKIRPLGAELFHVAGQTDMTKVIAAFRNFSNVPTIGKLLKEKIVPVSNENLPWRRRLAVSPKLW
jgi:hypothetical protein